jgi:hypothetical protein
MRRLWEDAKEAPADCAFVLAWLLLAAVVWTFCLIFLVQQLGPGLLIGFILGCLVAGRRS